MGWLRAPPAGVPFSAPPLAVSATSQTTLCEVLLHDLHVLRLLSLASGREAVEGVEAEVAHQALPTHNPPRPVSASLDSPPASSSSPSLSRSSLLYQSLSSSPPVSPSSPWHHLLSRYLPSSSFLDSEACCSVAPLLSSFVALFSVLRSPRSRPDPTHLSNRTYRWTRDLRTVGERRRVANNNNNNNNNKKLFVSV